MNISPRFNQRHIIHGDRETNREDSLHYREIGDSLYEFICERGNVLVMKRPLKGPNREWKFSHYQEGISECS